MDYYKDDYGSHYRIFETTFENPVTKNPTLLFTLVNESDTVIKASVSSYDVANWVTGYQLTLLKSSPDFGIIQKLSAG